MKKTRSDIKSIQALFWEDHINSILIYGSPSSVIVFDEIIKGIDNIEIEIIDYLDLSKEKLEMSLFNYSIFKKKTVIKVINCGANLSSEIKSILNLEFNNKIIFIAENLPPSSSLRKYFEDSKSAVALAIYEGNKTEIIKNFFAKTPKKISSSAAEYLATNFEGHDPSLIKELEKLSILMLSLEKELDLEDIKSLISQSFITIKSLESNKIGYFFALQDEVNYFKELNNLLLLQNNPVFIIRSILNLYLSFYTVKCRVKDDKISTDEAIKYLKPQVFFKDIPIFKSCLNKLSYFNIIRDFKTLYKAEISIKSGIGIDENLCSQIFYRVL